MAFCGAWLCTRSIARAAAKVECFCTKLPEMARNVFYRVGSRQRTQKGTAAQQTGGVRSRGLPLPSKPAALPPSPRGRLQAMPESLPSRQRRPLGVAVERSETEGVSAGKLPQSKPDGFASSLGEGASGETGHFALEQGAFPPCQRPHPRGGCRANARLGEFPGRWDDLECAPLRSAHK